jgi:hypothetical protein
MDSPYLRYIMTDRPGQKLPAVPFAERRQNVRNLNLEQVRNSMFYGYIGDWRRDGRSDLCLLR